MKNGYTLPNSIMSPIFAPKIIKPTLIKVMTKTICFLRQGVD